MIEEGVTMGGRVPPPLHPVCNIQICTEGHFFEDPLGWFSPLQKGLPSEAFGGTFKIRETLWPL